MNKQYRLRKDSPCDKAGCIFQWDNESGAYVGVLMSNSQYTKDVVENNPEWFEEIKPVFLQIYKGAQFSDIWAALWDILTDLEIRVPDTMRMPCGTLATHIHSELETCWNAARMNDPFHRGIPHIPKYKHFADYMAAKLKSKQ